MGYCWLYMAQISLSNCHCLLRYARICNCLFKQGIPLRRRLDYEHSPFKPVIHILHGVIALEFYLPKIKLYWLWTPHLLKTVQYILYKIEISKPIGALIFFMSYVKLQMDKRCLYYPFNDDYYLVFTIRQIYKCVPFFV